MMHGTRTNKPTCAEGVVWTAQRIPTAVNVAFLDRSYYCVFQVAPQLSTRVWVDSVPDSLILRKSDSAGKLTRNHLICSQELWPLDHRSIEQYRTVHRYKVLEDIFHCYRHETSQRQCFSTLHNIQQQFTKRPTCLCVCGWSTVKR
jgi:hypothetical protein